MHRLVAFGCSYTFGDSLPDCQSGAVEYSKLAWPSILSKDLGLQLINNGSCGAANKKILLDILKFSFYSTDTVIVLWSFANRGLLFDENGHTSLINKYDKNFYQVHTDYDLVMDTILQIHHANTYLQTKVKNYLSFYFDKSLNNFLCDAGPMQVPMMAEFMPMNHLAVDKASDGMHPGVQSHRNMAGHIFSRIR